MNKFFCYSLILLIASLASDSYGHFTGKGHVHTLSQKKQDFSNGDCQWNGTCDLKRFTLTTSEYEVWFSDDPNHPTYGNGAIFEYETDSLDALEKYAIVQFMKGCVFDSSKNGHGKIERHVTDTVASFGENIPFCFPEWVIDSQDTDPVYNSDPKYGRFYLLRWNKPGSYDERTQKYYGREKPRTPVLYMRDYPSGAFVSRTGVRNAALEFKTCVYKAGDVPKETRRDNIHFARPISCFEWQNVYVYDFASRRFRTEWADIPAREQPYARVNVKILIVFAALFIALTLLTCLTLRRFFSQKDA
jgi:hypothetical protein